MRKVVVAFAILLLGVVAPAGLASASPLASEGGVAAIGAPCDSRQAPFDPDLQEYFTGSSKVIACGKCNERGMQLDAQGVISGWKCYYSVGTPFDSYLYY